MGLEEQHHTGVLDGIAIFGQNHTMDHAARDEAKSQVASILVRPGDDGRAVLVVLVVEGSAISAFGCSELILARSQLVEREMAIPVGFNRSDGVTVLLREHGDSSVAQGIAARGVYYRAGDA